MRGGSCSMAWAFLAGALGGAACGSQFFACDDDAQCGEGGSCVRGWCAFMDDDCDSGLRWGEHAGESLDGVCTPEAGTGTGSADDAATGGQDGSAGTSSGGDDGDADGGPGTTLAVDGTGSSTGAPGQTSEGSSSGGEPLDPDLVAWYRCEQDDPFADATGNGHDGTCTSCPAIVPGRDGGACEFTGTDEAITIEHDAAFELTELTLAAWVRADPIPDGRLYTVAAKPHAPDVGTANVYEIGFNHFNAPEVALMCYGSDADVLCNSAEIVAGRWMHLAMTYDGAVGRLYVDGQEVAQAGEPTDGLLYDGSPLLIGLDLDNGAEDHPMDGLVDDVRLYARALTPAELAAL